MEKNIVTSPSGTVNDTERWSSIIGGSALVLMGLSQRSLRGVLMAVAGGGLAYHGATSQKSLSDKVADQVGLNQAIRVEKSVTIINKTPAELYKFWRNFENLPKFMNHLKSVQILDNNRSLWVANTPIGAEVKWNAEIVTDQENEFISWISMEDADIENSGFVRFKSAPAGRGTEVKVVLEYNPPGGTFGAAIAKLFGEEPEQQIGDELRNLKMLMETGEIATTTGQPRCQ